MNVDELLTEAFDRLPALVRAAVGGLTPAQLCTPVTLGVRLVSVLSDDLQHVGQAAYVRGLLMN